MSLPITRNETRQSAPTRSENSAIGLTVAAAVLGVVALAAFAPLLGRLAISTVHGTVQWGVAVASSIAHGNGTTDLSVASVFAFMVIVMAVAVGFAAGDARKDGDHEIFDVR